MLTTISIRKVKCDETRPHCLRCQNSKRTCDGYLPDDDAGRTSRGQILAMRPMTRPQLAQTPPGAAVLQQPDSHSPAAAPPDMMYFDLYRRANAASGAASLLPSTFWHRDVVQLAHSEPAIWHATVAMGALHHSGERDVRGGLEGEDAQAALSAAMAHYGQAMALGKGLDAPDKIVALSLALAGSAAMLHYWSQMQQHVLGGLRVLQGQISHEEEHRREPSPLARRLDDVSNRVAIHSMTYSDSTCPYPYAEAVAVVDADRLLAARPLELSSIEDASGELMSLFHGFFLLEEGALAKTLEFGPFMTKSEALLRRLADWEAAITRLERARRHARPSPEEEKALLSVRLFHCHLRIMMGAARQQQGGARPEMGWDDRLGEFEYAVRLALALEARMADGAAASVSFEPGMVAFLFYHAHRCRHPSVRRAAVDLLVRLGRVEALWRSDAAGAAAGKVVEVEEEGIDFSGMPAWIPAPLGSSGDDFVPWRAWSRKDFVVAPSTVSWVGVPRVPETRRVRDVLGMTSLGERKTSLRLLLEPRAGEEHGEVRDYEVHF